MTFYLSDILTSCVHMVKVVASLLKKITSFFLQIFKVCFLNTCLAKFLFKGCTLSVSFGFHGLPFLAFKTDQLKTLSDILLNSTA